MKQLPMLLLTVAAIALSGTPPALCAGVNQVQAAETASHQAQAAETAVHQVQTVKASALPTLVGQYDSNDGQYYYRFQNGAEFTGTVQNGDITTNVVSFRMPDQITATVKNGGETSDYDSEQFLAASGEYEMIFTSGEEEAAVHFTIVQMNQASGYDLAEEVMNVVPLKQSYDPAKKRFVQSLPGGAFFYSTIPQNLMTSGAVLFHGFPRGMVYVITRDGADISYESGQTITESGSYRLRVMCLPSISLPGAGELSGSGADATAGNSGSVTSSDFDSGNSLTADMQELDALAEGQISEQELEAALAEESLSEGSQSQSMQSQAAESDTGTAQAASAGSRTVLADFCFTIASAPMNLNTFQAPTDYRISQVLLEGKPVKAETENKLLLKQDGSYQLRLTGKTADLPEIITSFTRDTKPPLLSFEGVDKSGKARKHFRMFSDEQGVSYQVTRDGWPIENVTEEIRFSGLYRIQVMDQAGNGTSYLVHLKGGSNLWILLLVILIACGGIGMLYLHFGDIRRREKPEEQAKP